MKFFENKRRFIKQKAAFALFLILGTAILDCLDGTTDCVQAENGELASPPDVEKLLETFSDDFFAVRFESFLWKTDDVFWRVDPRRRTVGAIDPRTNSPLWSDDGIVFRLSPPNENRETSFQELEESDVSWDESTNEKTNIAEKFDANEKISSTLNDENEERSGISSINGRLFVLFQNFDENDPLADSETNDFESDSGTTDSANISEETVRNRTSNRREPSIGSSLLISLDPQAEGRLVWSIRSSDISQERIRILSVPQKRTSRGDSLWVPFEIVSFDRNDVERNESNLEFRSRDDLEPDEANNIRETNENKRREIRWLEIDGATGEFSIVPNRRR